MSPVSDSRVWFARSGVRALAGCLLIVLSFSLHAAENHWTGAAGDNLWTTSTNWSLGIVPDSSHDVFIEQTTTNGALLNDMVSVASFTLGGTSGPAILNVTNGAFLMCSGSSLVRTGAVLNLNGVIGGNALCTVEGVVNSRSFSFWNGTIEIRPQGTLNMSGTLPSVFGNVRNAGTVVCSVATLETPDATHQFINSNLFILHSNLTVRATSGMGLPAFINLGTIDVPPHNGTVQFSIMAALTNNGILRVGTNTTLELRVQTGLPLVSFENGTVFDGDGIVSIPAIDTYRWDGTQTLNCTIEYSGIGVLGQPSWTGTGEFRWHDGAMGNFTFLPGFKVQCSNMVFMNGNCTNLTTIKWRGRFEESSGLRFYNLGTLAMDGDCEVRANGITPGSFNNSGTILLPSDQTNSFTINARFTNSGAIKVESNSVLSILSPDSGTATFANGTVFDGPGKVRFPNGLPINFDGALTLNTTLDFFTDGSGGQPHWTGPGLFRWLGGVLGAMTFEPGFQVEASGSDYFKFLLGNCTNQGTFRWLGGSPVILISGFIPTAFYNAGQFQLEANATWGADLPFVNLPAGVVDQTSDQFAVGSLTNFGTLQLHKGALIIASNFVSLPGSSHRLVMGSTIPVTGFNQLSAPDLALDGSLVVTLTNGFVPAIGNSFTLATNTTTQSGQFASVTLPTLPSNLAWEIRYLPDAVVLNVIQPLSLGSTAYQGNGTFQFTLTGPVASAYTIEASSNLVNWVTIETNSPFSGLVIFTDTNAVQFNRRFYRGRIFP